MFQLQKRNHALDDLEEKKMKGDKKYYSNPGYSRLQINRWEEND